MYGRIIEDLINDGSDGIESRQDYRFHPMGAQPNGKLHIWQALDDDRIPYYVGVADDETLETIFTWAQHDAGVTILQVLKLPSMEWEDTIS